MKLRVTIEKIYRACVDVEVPDGAAPCDVADLLCTDDKMAEMEASADSTRAWMYDELNVRTITDERGGVIAEM